MDDIQGNVKSNKIAPIHQVILLKGVTKQKEKLSKIAQSILKNESTIMSTMRHPSVVAFKRIFENPKFIILEMELILGGQLKKLFKRQDGD